MKFSGMACEGKKNHKTFLKLFSPKSRFSKLWFSNLPVEELCTQIYTYNRDLNQAKIKIPRLLNLRPINDNSIELEQEWINGKNIEELLPQLDQNQLLSLFTELLQLQKKGFEFNKNLRIDLNIDNFVMDATVCLVDITPPLYVGVLPYPERFIDQCYYHLCFSRTNQISELVFNFLKKTVLSSLNPVKIGFLFNSLLDQAEAIWRNEFGSLREKIESADLLNYDSYNRTIARLKLMQVFCNSQMDSKIFLNLLRTMSISNLLKIEESNEDQN